MSGDSNEETDATGCIDILLIWESIILILFINVEQNSGCGYSFLVYRGVCLYRNKAIQKADFQQVQQNLGK